MADKTYDNLTIVTGTNATDLIALYPPGGPLKVIAYTNLVAALATSLSPTFLTQDNNLSDLNSAGVARTNLGLGTVATYNTGTTAGTIALLGTGGKTPISTLPGGYLAKTANYTVVAADNGKLVDVTSGSPTITLPDPSAAGIGETYFVEICNSGSGTVTVNTTAGTINGLSSIVQGPGVLNSFFNNGTNYFARGGSSAGGILHVQLQKPSGTDSGESVPAGSWGTRLLDTVLTNTITGASVASNTATLPAGTYRAYACAPSMVGNANAALRARLYNATAGAALRYGPNHVQNSGNSPLRVYLRPEVHGVFTLTTTSDVQLQTFGSSGVSPVGTGYGVVSTGEPEIFNEMIIEKIG